MCPAGGSPHSTDITQNNNKRGDHSPGQGKLYLVGIGPGSPDELTPRARAAITACEVIVGYSAYIRKIKPLLTDQQVISSGMGRELERANLAIDEALAGKQVAVISSGDAGIYGCAGVAFELLKNRKLKPDLEVIPGVTAAISAAACLGAPLANDYAAISLSDLLTPWEVIERRIKSALEADLVLALYNPKSKGRAWQIERVRELALGVRPADTPVGIVSDTSRPDEQVTLTDLDNFLKHPINMSSTVIIGNSTTFTWQEYMITHRGYSLKDQNLGGHPSEEGLSPKPPSQDF